MMAGIFAMHRIIVVIIAVVVLFGSSQLPKNIGSAGRGFRRAHQEAGGEIVPVEEESTTS
jgi:Sec-independent protein translocase protein TatA